MIDNYAIITIIIRAIAIGLLVVVLKRQIELIKSPTLLRFKILLMTLVAIILFGNVFSILTNLFRQPDGNLYENVRHISMVWNSISALSSGIILNMLYNTK